VGVRLGNGVADKNPVTVGVGEAVAVSVGVDVAVGGNGVAVEVGVGTGVGPRYKFKSAAVNAVFEKIQLLHAGIKADNGRPINAS
jgi:hypothetical protein